MAKGSSKKRARLKPEVVPQVRDALEWLPRGWILEIKTQSSGERVGKKYKCYFDPLSGSRFYSKAKVLRFLESGNVYTATSRGKRHFKASATDNVLAQIEYSPDGLPHGWIKEKKFRKSNLKRIKADPYYTDPVNGYVFRSLKDAIHYVETGQISKHAVGSRKRSIHEMYSLEKESPLPIPVKKLKSLRSSTRRCLFTEGASTSNREATVEIDASPDKLILPPPDHASSESFQKAKKNKRKVLETANGEQNTRRGRPMIEMSKSVIMLEEKDIEIDKLLNKLKLPAPDHASSKSFQHVDLTSSPSLECSQGKTSKKRKKELKAAADNSLDTASYEEQKTKRESQPKTRFRSEKEKKRKEGLQVPPTVIVTAPPISQDKKQQRAIKSKLVNQRSKRLAGIDPAPVTDLVIRPSLPSMSNDGGNGIKESVPLAETKSYEEWNQRIGSFSGERKKELKAAADNSLDTGSHEEQKTKRGSQPKTRFRSEKEKKREEGLQLPPTVIVTAPPISQDKKQQRAIKSKLVNQRSKRLAGIDTAPVTDLVIRPSHPSMSNDGGNGIKESVPLAETERMDTKEKYFLEENMLFKGQALGSSFPLASLPFGEFWPDRCIEVAVKKRENRAMALIDNSLVTSSYQEQKAKRESLPKTRFRSDKEKKRSGELQELPTTMKTPSVSRGKKQQRAVKNKSVITLRQSSKRLAGLEHAPFTDLVIHRPSFQSTSNGECNEIKESVPLMEPKRMDIKEKASLGELVLLKGQTLESSSPLASLPSNEVWPDPCTEFTIKKIKMGLRATTDNSLGTSSFREQKAKRRSLPKTGSRYEKEMKESKECSEQPPTIEKLSEPTNNETTEKHLRAIKDKSVIALPRRSSKRLVGLEAAPIADLVVYCPSHQSTSNSDCNGIKDLVYLPEPERMDSEEKSFGEQVLLKGQTSEDQSSSSPLVSVTLGDFWQDPCIEFAVKTLMGEIPVPDEGIGIEMYVQKQLSSSLEMEKLNPSASAIAATDNAVRSIASVELLPEKKHLRVPISDEGKACPSENGLASDANGIQKVMQKLKELGL